MDIGKRFRDLRAAKGLSQGDIEKRTGLLRCYVPRVENGYTIPSLQTLERWAKALDLELYQLFFVSKEKPVAPEVAERAPVGAQAGELLKFFTRLSKPNQRLLLDMARKLVSAENRK